MSKLCLACGTSGQNLLHNKTTKLAKWIKKEKRTTALPTRSLPEPGLHSEPKQATVQIRIHLGGKDRPILYWAAKARKITDPIPNATTAYGRYPNMGSTTVHNGWATLRLQAPRPYLEEDTVWPAHVHYVESSSHGEWDHNPVHVIAGYPGHHGKTFRNGAHEYEMTCINHGSQKCSILTPKQVRKYWKHLTVINALPMQYGDVPMTEAMKKHHLKLPSDTNERFLKAFCQINQHKPYVVYCANSECGAASTLIGKLVALGCVNAYYMPAGTAGWK